MKKICLNLILIFSLIQATGCSTLNPKEEDINASAVEAYKEFKSKAKISTNAEWTAMVNRVAGRIAKSSGANFDWEWILVESPDVNAWAMPGGKIAVYTGIMPVLQTEAALAAVLGHEVAHATMKHGHKGYSRAMKGNLAGLLIGGAALVGGQLLCKTEACKVLTGLGGAAGGFAVAFFNNKFSRQQETEADKVGQSYMAKAGYDPAESIVLWQRMSASKKGAAPPEFMSTHPSDEHRQNNLRGWLPETEKQYQASTQKYGLGETIR